MNNSIALICDDNYVMPTIVTLQSVKDSYKGGKSIDVYICTFGLTPNNCDKLLRLSSGLFNVEIKTCKLQDFGRYLDRINQKTHVTPTSLIKFELPNILRDVDVLLYLDSDIIVKGNLEELFNIDISNKYLAAAPEIWSNLNKYWANNDYSLENSFYFNSGVLLYNLKRMREDNIPEKLWAQKIENSKDVTKKTMDQDSLNDVCAKETLILPIKWNFNTAFSNKNVIRLDVLNEILKASYLSHEELVEDARILHYVGKEDKPWKYSSANCVEYWEQSYKKAGLELQNLDRTSVKHGLGWYINIICKQCRDKGFIYTLRYLFYKVKTIK